MTRNKRIFLVSAILIGLSGVWPLSDSAASTKKGEDEAARWSSYSVLNRRSHNSASFKNENLLLQDLRTALGERSSSARIYYQTECSHEQWDALPFTRVRVVKPLTKATGIAEVRAMFASNGTVKVAQGGGGMIRIKFGEVSSGILQTKIRRVVLSGVQRYDAASAIDAIQETTEIKAAERKFHLGPPAMLSNGGPPLPEEVKRHLPSSISNVTFDEALDIVAKTLGGVVFYGECRDKKGVHLYYVYHRDIEDFNR